MALGQFSSTEAGIVPSSGGGTTNFLRADGTFSPPAGGGDMVLASAQTNSGIKTFLDTTMKLRNVANTFDGYFVNTNTANRVYTLKDAAGTLAFTTDITGTNSGTNTGDQTTIVGITGTTAQFNTALTDNDFATLAGIESLTNKKLGSLTTNGFVKTSAGDGTLSIDTSTYLTANQSITLSGDVSGTGSTAITTAIGANKVANSMLAQMATLTIKGNNTGGTANVLDLTVAQVNAILPVFTSTLNGLVPLSGGGTTTYLRADGTFATVTSTAPDIALSLVAPSIDETITAGYSAYISDTYEIASSFMLDILTGSVFEIG